MATQLRPYQLANLAAPDGTEVLILDRNDFTDTVQSTINDVLAVESVPRIAADTAIETGAGLAAGVLSPEPSSTYLKNADYIAAGYNVNLRSSTLLLDAAISNLAASGETEIQFDLSSAEILALAVAITKIVKPGVGLVYHWYECDTFINFVTTPYVTAGANGIDVIFQGGSDQIVRLPKTFVESAASSHRKFLIASHELLTDTAIQVIAPDGNPINGDSPITIRLEGKIKNTLSTGAATPVSNCCTPDAWDSFTAADVTALGNIVCDHGLNTQIIMVGLQDNTGAFIAASFTLGDEGGADPYNKITIPVGLGIVGTWTWLVKPKR